MDIHGLSAHPMGEIAGKVTREYNVSMDIHGLSAHPMGEMAEKVTREYNVSMDMYGLSVHPMGGDGLLGNTMYLWISMDCPRTPWGEMAGKVAQEYNAGVHGYQWTVRAPHGGGGGRWLLGNPWTIKRGCIRTYRDNQENVCSQISVSTYTERRSFKLI